MNKISASDNILNFLYDVDYDYFRISETKSKPIGRTKTDIIDVTLELSLDRYYNYRAVYGFLQFMGDIGGLYGILFPLSQILMIYLVQTHM